MTNTAIPQQVMADPYPAVPAELKRLRQWVVWRYETRDDSDKPTKVPYQPNGSLASSTNPATWASYQAVIACRQKYDGIGFVFHGQTGVDLDHHIEGGQLSPYARQVIERLGSYSEYSPSGTGVHILCVGSLPPGGRKNKVLGLEMYDEGRFFTITGKHIPGTPDHLAERPAELAALHREAFPPKPTVQRPIPTQPVDKTDAEIIQAAMNSRDGAAFTRLWTGQGWQADYKGDQSAADLALCNKLAQWTGSDPARIDSLFRQSGLMRPKWDERHYSSGETYGERTVSKAIETTQITRTPRANLVQTNGNRHARADIDRTVEMQKPSPDQKPTKPPAPSHSDLATLIVEDWRGGTVYGLADWRRYNGGVWPVEEEDIIKAEVKRAVVNAQAQGIRPTSGVVSSVMELARLDVITRSSVWDANPDLLPCRNGVLHIPSLTLSHHRPENYFTYRTAYDYDPAATAETWRYSLASTHDEETQQFLQEWAGYCLTTDVRYEIAVWLYGQKGSGKSTYIEGLRAMLGDRAGILGLADVERSRFALGGIVGKTMLSATEQPAMYMQRAELLNTIISGEPLTVEKKFKDPVEITPFAKILWAMNELPRISESGSGIFRRVKVVKFPNRAEGERDPRVKEAIKLEGSGILNWALEGLGRLRERGGFVIPAAVQAASERFEKTNNVPALFVEDRCITGPDYKEQSGRLYEEYANWCKANGHQAQSSTSIANEWEAMGFIRYRAAGKSYWRGVGLLLE